MLRWGVYAVRLCYGYNNNIILLNYSYTSVVCDIVFGVPWCDENYLPSWVFPSVQPLKLYLNVPSPHGKP